MNPESPFTDQLDAVLPGREASWRKAGGRTILMTGGTGFVGTWMLELFCRANRVFRLDARILVLTRDPASFALRCPHLAGDPALKLLEGDVRHFDPGTEPFSWVVHGAASSHGPLAAAAPLEHLDTIVLGTRQVLEIAAKARAERMLYLSSGAVYGPQPPELERLEETFPGAPDPLDPATGYAQGKRMAEHLCLQYRLHAGLEPVIARGFAFFGPGLPLDAHFAMGNFIRDSLAGGPIIVQGDGTPFRSYLYGSDLALCLWLLLLEGRSGQAYNVGSDQAIQLADLARVLADRCGTAVIIRSAAREGILPSRYVPSTEKVRHEIGFLPTVSLRDGLDRSLRWYERSARATHP